MLWPQKRRGNDPSTNVPVLARNPKDMMMSDINYFNGLEHCSMWDKIYKIFNKKCCLAEYDDIVVYHNIKESDIYVIVAFMILFP
jgi:hypothetical protein